MNFLLALVFLSGSSLASDSDPDYCTAEITRYLTASGCVAKVIPISESGFGSILCCEKQTFLAMDHGKHRAWLKSHSDTIRNEHAKELSIKELIVAEYKSALGLSLSEVRDLLSTKDVCTSNGVIWWSANAQQPSVTNSLPPEKITDLAR